MNQYDLPVKIIRLKTSEDLVAFVEESNSYTTIYSPMCFNTDWDTESESNSLYINHYLPINMIEENVITISNDNILFIVDAKEEFAEYYISIITDVEESNEMNSKCTNVVNTKLH
jgi:hypothetical protein